MTRILSAAIQAVDPGAAVGQFLRREKKKLFVGEQEYLLEDIDHIYLVGAGKAGVPMAQAIIEFVGDRVEAGVLIVKEGYTGGIDRLGSVTVLEAGHPLPDQRGIEGAKKMKELLEKSSARDLVISLISGGGSALLTRPAGGLSLEDLREMTDQLLASGATINEFNTLRKHVDQMKGGGLARMAAPALVITLILSDVVGNPLDIIASGPTVPDPSTYADALQVLDKYGIRETIPESILMHLEEGEAGLAPETPKPGDPIFDKVVNLLVGSNEVAAEAAIDAARQEGFQTKLLTNSLEGEASEKGRWLAESAQRIALSREPQSRPVCLVAGGETTVTLSDARTESGQGGRNQEMALAAVPVLAGLPDVTLITLATDGGDGPTDAAGAVVTGETLASAEARGLSPEDFLARHDSYHFFDPLGDLLRPGPTQTNVNDLAFVFLF